MPKSTPPINSVLVADVGGTTTRFAVVERNVGLELQGSVACDSAASLEELIERYIDALGNAPEAAIFAIAGPVEGDVVKMTNLPWRICGSVVRKRFGFSYVRLINDFEAVALAVSRLQPADVRTLGKNLPEAGPVKLVFGPGTGLGVAALLQYDGTYDVLASEGGHIAFGPTSTEEVEIFSRLQGNLAEIKAETILSGPGLERLHRAMHGEPLSAEEITLHAENGEPSASATVKMFVQLLGRLARDLALVFKAEGGVYIAGGVSQRLGDLIEDEAFRSAFERHSTHRQVLAGIGTHLITNEEPGLLGCAVLAERLFEKS